MNITMTITADNPEELFSTLAAIGKDTPNKTPAFATPAVVLPTPAASAPVQAPVTVAPTFTLEQVGKAGADLIAVNPAKMPELLALLTQFEARAIAELKPDQIGAFATALRGLGGKI